MSLVLSHEKSTDRFKGGSGREITALLQNVEIVYALQRSCEHFYYGDEWLATDSGTP